MVNFDSLLSYKFVDNEKYPWVFLDPFTKCCYAFSESKFRAILMALLKSVSTVGFYTALSRVLGFVRDMLVARYLGAGAVADAFFVAFKLPNFFRRLFAEGAFNAAFVPLFSRLYAREGLEKACRATESVLILLLGSLLLLVLVFEILMPTLMLFFAPGFHDEPQKLAWAVAFSRLTFPYILFISLAAFYSGILNAIGIFSIPAAAPILLNLNMIGAVLSVGGEESEVGYALSWGVMGAGLLQFLWIMISAFRKDVRFRLRTNEAGTRRQFLKALLPGALGAGVTQVNLLIDVVIASFLPTGAVSYLFYADRLNQLPLSIIGIALATALLPALSKAYESKEEARALFLKQQSLVAAMGLTLPAMTGFLVMAHPMIDVLFGNGAFGARDVLMTSSALQAFSLGLPAYVLAKILSVGFFARYDTKTPVRIALGTVAFNTLVSLSLMPFLEHIGLALSTALSAWLNVAFLYRGLVKRKHFYISAENRRSLIRIFLSCGVMGSALFLYEQIFPMPSQDKSIQILWLGFLIGVGFLTYLIAALFLNIISPSLLKERLGKHIL